MTIYRSFFSCLVPILLQYNIFERETLSIEFEFLTPYFQSSKQNFVSLPEYDHVDGIALIPLDIKFPAEADLTIDLLHLFPTSFPCTI